MLDCADRLGRSIIGSSWPKSRMKSSGNFVAAPLPRSMALHYRRAESGCVARWGQAELAGLFVAELRNAFVADGEGNTRRVPWLSNEQLAALEQANLLLVLNWAHGRHGFEVTIERGVADASSARCATGIT